MMNRRISAVAAILWLTCPCAALAEDTPDQQTTVATPRTSEQPTEPGDAGSKNSIQSSLGRFGDPGGFRSFLADRGITYDVTYIGETLGNLSGGERRGAIYEGRLDIQLEADLDKLVGWKGATLHAQMYQIHGHGLSRYYLANLNTVSSIEALSSTRLNELWLEQKMLDDHLAIRVGQLAADTEFFNSQTASLFVNATFGWPSITATNLPSGGPAYPLATPGIRARITDNDRFSLLVGLFNGDPAGKPNPYGTGPTDPQILNSSGTNFRLQDPPFLIAEGSYALSGKDSELPGTVKLGYWHHFGTFDDQRVDTSGLLLADPSTTGIARRLRGNDGVYAIIDQSIYRKPGTKDQGAAVFVRLSGSPGDRNEISFYVDTGIAYKGLIPGRPNDTAGIALSYLQISTRARQYDFDQITFTGNAMPVRNSEAVIEATYQAEIVPGFTVQPDLQYVIRPGGNVVNAYDPYGRREKNAAVAGIRTTIHY